MSWMLEVKHSKYVQGTFSFQFKNREQYLEFRNDWKTKYKKLSEEIRYAKQHRKPSKPDYDPSALAGFGLKRFQAKLEMQRITEAKEFSKEQKAKSKESIPVLG